MIPKFFLVFLTSLLSFVAPSQSLRSWVWDSYKLKFEAPDNMEIVKSDATVYEASNRSITMDIYPRKGDGLTYDGMKNAIVKWANKLNMYYTVTSSGKSQPIYMENLNGLWGCAIDGSKDHFSAFVLLLVNPDNPDVIFYIWISYAKEYYHDAVSILKSFAPM